MEEINKIWGQYIDSFNTEAEYNIACKLLPHVSEINGLVKYIPLGEYEKNLKLEGVCDFGGAPTDQTIDNWWQAITIEFNHDPTIEVIGDLVGKISVGNELYYLWKLDFNGNQIWFEHTSVIPDTGWGLTTTIDQFTQRDVIFDEAPEIQLLDDNKNSAYGKIPIAWKIWKTS